MFKLVKISLLLGFTAVIIYLIYSSFIDNDSFGQYIYWLLLVDLLCFILFFKKSSRFSLYSAFISFIVSFIILSLGFNSIADFFMRLSFIFMLTGYVQSLIEVGIKRKPPLINSDNKSINTP